MTAADGTRATEVAPGVHRLGSRYVNWYLVETGDGAVAVDAGFRGYARTLEADLRAAGSALARIRAVVLTHGDVDHIGLVPVLTAEGAAVHLHPADAGLVTGSRKSTEANPLPYLIRHRAPRRFLRHALRAGGLRRPRIARFHPLTDGQPVGATGLRAIHTPGHTPGHCVLHLPDRGVLFAGDQLCTHDPLTGRSGIQMPARATNVDSAAVLRSLERVAGLDADIVLCGHGEPFRGSPADAAKAARPARLP